MGHPGAAVRNLGGSVRLACPGREVASPDKRLVTFTVDEDMMPDPDGYRDDLRASFGELVRAVGERRR